jgi:hypothetical protein
VILEFTQSAVSDLEKISQYTRDTWGEEQENDPPSLCTGAAGEIPKHPKALNSKYQVRKTGSAWNTSVYFLFFRGSKLN